MCTWIGHTITISSASFAAQDIVKDDQSAVVNGHVTLSTV